MSLINNFKLCLQNFLFNLDILIYITSSLFFVCVVTLFNRYNESYSNLNFQLGLLIFRSAEVTSPKLLIFFMFLNLY